MSLEVLFQFLHYPYSASTAFMIALATILLNPRSSRSGMLSATSHTSSFVSRSCTCARQRRAINEFVTSKRETALGTHLADRDGSASSPSKQQANVGLLQQQHQPLRIAAIIQPYSCRLAMAHHTKLTNRYPVTVRYTKR